MNVKMKIKEIQAKMEMTQKSLESTIKDRQDFLSLLRREFGVLENKKPSESAGDAVKQIRPTGDTLISLISELDFLAILIYNQTIALENLRKEQMDLFSESFSLLSERPSSDNIILSDKPGVTFTHASTADTH